MQIETNMRDMFSYSYIPIIIVIIILIVINIRIKRKEKTPKIIEPNTVDKNAIKKKYLKEIYILTDNINNSQISNRIAFQKLSLLIRNFIFEMTNIKVQNYTLSEIEKINLPTLFELVKEYYTPEFSEYSSGNILESIAKTRSVIEKWN